MMIDIPFWFYPIMTTIP